MFDVAGYKKGEKWPALMMCLGMFFAQFGASTMPYASGLMSNFSLFQGMNPDASMFHSGGYLISSLLLDTALVVVVWLLIRFVIKPDVTKLKNYEAPKTKTKFTRDQNRALGILYL